MSGFEDSTINGWINQPGPINLRRSERRRDPTPMEPVILAVLVGLNIIVWLWNAWFH